MRSELLKSLLESKESGLTAFELSNRLGITRTAVQQHLAGLERDGLVEVVAVRRTAGRPSRAYGLSERGYEGFPRSYGLLAEGVLAVAADTLGEEAVEQLLGELAERLSGELSQRAGTGRSPERLSRVVEIMNELGYEATELPDSQGLRAANCVYHRVARQTRAVCRFDVKLLSALLGTPVSHTSCMLDGAGHCSFAPVSEPPPEE